MLPRMSEFLRIQLRHRSEFLRIQLRHRSEFLRIQLRYGSGPNRDQFTLARPGFPTLRPLVAGKIVGRCAWGSAENREPRVAKTNEAGYKPIGVILP